MAARIKWTRLIKLSWLGMSISLLYLGLGACLPLNCYYADSYVLPFMLLLSFPGGFVFIALAQPFVLMGPQDFAVVWLLAFAGGYLQWFWLVPKLTSGPEIITLNISHVREILSK